jgi:hydroxymethylbilane synthase
MSPLRLGTRASALASWQAEWVAAQLKWRGVAVELVAITTEGDRRSDAIAALGGRGAFTKEIQRSLLDGRIDLAVHSLKDLPTAGLPELCLAAVPERASPHDALVAASGKLLEVLPPQAVVGTGSPRRRAQLLRARPDLRIKDIRGNIDTRLRKLRSGGYDALVLAEAGLQRLGLADQITQTLPLEIMLPAAGQGALGIETRADDAATRRIVAALDHPPTHAAVAAERAMLESLGAGCLTPVGAFGQVVGDSLTLIGRALDENGARQWEARQAGTVADALDLGCRVAEALLSQGAGV